jgi:integrase
VRQPDGRYKVEPVQTYHLRWIDPVAGKWRSRKVGSDRKRALAEQAKLEGALKEGTHTNLRRITWAAFVAEHAGKLAGERNAVEADRTLTEFGKMLGIASPRQATFGAVESYVDQLRANGNRTATVNKKLRYLRGAFNKAVRRQCLAKNPMDGWAWQRENQKAIRVSDRTEAAALLRAIRTLFGRTALYGLQWTTFVYMALRTGGRRGELLGRSWDRIDLTGGRVRFANTKGKRDRHVSIDHDPLRRLLWAMRERPEADHLVGPFIGLERNLEKTWAKIVAKAGVAGVTIHGLRRTFATWLIRAGVPLPTVQKLAGHSSIQTTLTYYNWVSDDDLRRGMSTLREGDAKLGRAG